MVDGAWAFLAATPPYAAAGADTAAATAAATATADADGGDGGAGAFAALAAALSTCPSAAAGGDVGWFPPGTMTPAFEAAAVGHPPGAVVKVATEFGWHLLRVTAHAATASAVDARALGAALADARSQIVDVRSDAEVAFAALPVGRGGGAGGGGGGSGGGGGARVVHLPLLDFERWAPAWEADRAGLDASAPVFVVGHYGVEAAGFASFLTQGGCADVRVVVGGIDAFAADVDASVPRYGPEAEAGEEEGEADADADADAGGGADADAGGGADAQTDKGKQGTEAGGGA